LVETARSAVATAAIIAVDFMACESIRGERGYVKARGGGGGEEGE
jgi:hypothetical protein